MQRQGEIKIASGLIQIQEALAFGAGAALLVSGLAAISLWLRRPRPSSRLTLLGMAARNGAASPGRSLLSVALVAAACFVLVTVAANRRSEDAKEIPEGAGGFPLYAESSVPLAADPNDPDGGVGDGAGEEAFVSAESFAVAAGGNALNSVEDGATGSLWPLW